ncbi:MAG: trypsin-like peptidase domain-containing protein [Oscillospiraceae bacterium]|nr:trypsin-like peptidase domain-containing protein [Oscillospiraceae bacterium]
MEPFENDMFENEQEQPQGAPQESIPPQPRYIPEEPADSQPTAYHGAGAGRKESPYADSPYVMNEAPRPEYHYQPQTQPPVKPKKAKKARKGIWKGILAAVLAIALVATGCGITAFAVNEYWEERNEATIDMLTDKIEALEKQISTNGTVPVGTLPEDLIYTPGSVYSQCVNSVVAITTTVQGTGFYGSSGSSAGSGFIFSEDGYIITNYHVVENATSITVTTHDGTEYEAELKGYDSSANDLALLKVEATGLPAAAIGNSGSLSIGDMVVAIGNPLGELTSTQTVGYVSGIGREVATDSLTTINMIQTDAAINPGNSGGPLFNMRGEVIGITTAKYSGSTGSGASIEGIGFAIPIDDVMTVLGDLMDYGYVNSAYMGVSVQNTDESAASMFGLPTGAYIASVDKGGAAERAGIQPKDIVIAVGEHKVSNVTDLTRALRNFKAGDTTTVTLIRSGQEMTLEITLDERPQKTGTETVQPENNGPKGGTSEDWYDYFRRYFGD